VLAKWQNVINTYIHDNIFHGSITRKRLKNILKYRKVRDWKKKCEQSTATGCRDRHIGLSTFCILSNNIYYVGIQF